MSMSRTTRMPLLALGALVGLVTIGMALGFARPAEAAPVPAAPTNMRRCPGPPQPCLALAGSIQAFWDDNATNETSYVFQWVRAAPPLVWQSAVLPANSTSTIQFGLVPGARYYVRVQACNANGCSAFSNTTAVWA